MKVSIMTTHTVDELIIARLTDIRMIPTGGESETIFASDDQTVVSEAQKILLVFGYRLVDSSVDDAHYMMTFAVPGRPSDRPFTLVYQGEDTPVPLAVFYKENDRLVQFETDDRASVWSDKPADMLAFSVAFDRVHGSKRQYVIPILRHSVLARMMPPDVRLCRLIP